MKSSSHHLRCIENPRAKIPTVLMFSLSSQDQTKAIWHSMFDDDSDEDGGLWVWQNMMQLYFMQQE